MVLLPDAIPPVNPMTSGLWCDGSALLTACSPAPAYRRKESARNPTAECPCPWCTWRSRHRCWFQRRPYRAGCRSRSDGWGPEATASRPSRTCWCGTLHRRHSSSICQRRGCFQYRRGGRSSCASPYQRRQQGDRPGCNHSRRRAASRHRGGTVQRRIELVSWGAERINASPSVNAWQGQAAYRGRRAQKQGQRAQQGRFHRAHRR